MTARAAATILPVGAGLMAAATTLAAALAIKVELALAVPLGMLVALAMFTRPILGLGLLFFFALMDAVEEALTGPLGISGFRSIALITLAGAVMVTDTRRQNIMTALREPSVRLGLAFSACVAISTLLAIDKRVAAEAGMRLLSVSLLLYLTVLIVQNMRNLRIVIGVLVGSMVVSALILIAEIFLHVTVVSSSNAALSATTAEGVSRSSGGSNHDPTTAALMMLMVVTLALMLALEGRRHRALLLAAAGIGSVALIFSFARSAMLVYSLVLVAAAFRYRHSRYAPAGVILGLIFLIFMLPFVPASYFERFSSLFEGISADWTLGRRLTYQITGFDILRQYPVFGVGPGNYNELFTDPAYRYLPGRTLLPRPLHNMYLSVAVEYGLVGFFFFMALVAMSIRSLLSVLRAPANDEIRTIALALLFAAAGFFFASVMNPHDDNKYTWILLGLGPAVGVVNRHLSVPRLEHKAEEDAP